MSDYYTDCMEHMSVTADDLREAVSGIMSVFHTLDEASQEEFRAHIKTAISLLSILDDLKVSIERVAKRNGVK